jgi:hypothetical protein
MSKPLPHPQRGDTFDVLRSMMTLLQRLIDSQATERLAPLKDADALFSTAASRWIVPLDNCGRIHREMSGHFCRLAAGGGFRKRRLYSDNDAYAVSVTRPLVLNGIALSLGRLDLLALMEERGGFMGTASELLRCIRGQMPCEEAIFMPKTPKNLFERLEELAPLLKEKGINLRKERAREGRLLFLERENQSL